MCSGVKQKRKNNTKDEFTEGKRIAHQHEKTEIKIGDSKREKTIPKNFMIPRQLKNIRSNIIGVILSYIA